MTPEESSKQVKIIDKKIEQFAQYLQRKNNLDHIQFLKIRLGMQVLAINIEKSIVVYGLCLLYTSPSPRDATLSRMPSSA